MKVVFITREGIDNPGARLRCYGWAKILREKHGIDVSVFSFADKLGGRAGINEEGFSHFEKIKMLGKSFFPLLRLSHKGAYFVVNRLNYHSLSARAVSAVRKAGFILDVDDWEADLPRYKTAAVKLLKKFAQDSIFCLSGSIFLQRYLRLYNPRSYYLPTGVDMELFGRICKDDIGGRDDKTVLSWHGTINRQENVEEISFLLDVFCSLQKKGHNVELSLMGEGPFKKHAAEEVGKRRAKGVFLRDWISWRDVPLYLKKVDIGVVPLKPSIYNASKSPTKIFEYMAAGKAVVASSVGEAREIIDSGTDGILCENKEDFVSQIELLIKNKNKREALGQNARLKAGKKYSLEIIAGKLCNIMRDNGIIN